MTKRSPADHENVTKWTVASKPKHPVWAPCYPPRTSACVAQLRSRAAWLRTSSLFSRLVKSSTLIQTNPKIWIKAVIPYLPEEPQWGFWSKNNNQTKQQHESAGWAGSIQNQTSERRTFQETNKCCCCVSTQLNIAESNRQRRFVHYLQLKMQRILWTWPEQVCLSLLTNSAKLSCWFILNTDIKY